MSPAAKKTETSAQGQSHEVPVVLCCTERDVEVVTSLAEALRNAHPAHPQVVLLEGETFDELSELAERNSGTTVLYVLCRGSDISVSAIQQVRTVLRGHAGGQFMTVQVSSVERMESSLAAALEAPRFQQGSPQRTPPSTIRGTPAANSRPPRRGAGLPGPRGAMTIPPAPPPSFGAPAPRTLPAGAAPPPSPEGGPRTLVGAAPPPDGPIPAAPPANGPGTLMGAAPPPEGPVAVPPPPEEPQAAATPPGTLMGVTPRAPNEGGPRTLMGAAPPPEGAVVPEQSQPSQPSADNLAGGWQVDDIDDAAVSGSATMTFGVSVHAQPTAAHSVVAAGVPKWKQWLSQGQEMLTELWSTDENRTLKLAIAGGIIVIVPVFVLLIWFAIGSSDDKDASVTPDRELANLSDPSKARAVQAGDPEPFEEELEDPDDPEGPDAAADPDPLERDEPLAGDVDAAKYQEFLRVESALRSSKIRGLDGLIIDTSKSRKLNFKSARRYCNRRESGKLSGWRLPTSRELSRVASANMVGKGQNYWAQPGTRSRSKQAYVWDARRKKVVKKSSRTRSARALCVRNRVTSRRKK